ncbi:penicillin-binding transpeptidase domain-containing protein [Acrocarpospora catenulata]|uniref:penicillin-binding transpeptidase domain-containing protein n=1 Tax=Acrocarpospora catenulata TaxID=2836182 RepID=UPI001BDACA6C|nr:penicillin-binding transpeptidase domain-containing protein [Acrocarpospora catenulata]
MRRRPLLILISVCLTIFVAGITGLILSGRSEPETVAVPTPSSEPKATLTFDDDLVDEVKGDPAETGTAYLRAWERGDLAGMAALVYELPGDFAALHQEFDAALAVESVRLTPGNLRRTGDTTALLAFTGVRKLKGGEELPFSSVLRLLVAELTWRVDWLPDTIHPQLQFGGHVVRRSIPGQAPLLATREGEPLPANSGAEPYVSDLMAGAHRGAAGWSAVIENPGQQPITLVKHEGEGPPPRVTTTIDRYVQMAAARALDGVSRPATMVVVRPSTGEVLAVADRLGGKGAFLQKFPPGSTFKIVTAAALLQAGLTVDATVSCPATYQIPQGRAINNYQGRDHGTLTLRQAFAQSCNTTFAQQAVERLSADTLTAAAGLFGFGGSLATGAGGTCGSVSPPQNDDALAEDSFGQGTVEASPLCMAAMAAAVQNGTWRAPRLVPADRLGAEQQTRQLDPGVVEGLRSMMAAVVTEGTAAGGGLPDGTAGKTGTAEVGQGRADHAWFVGYRGDLAFAVFVENGGTGSGAAVPIVARLLSAV